MNRTVQPQTQPTNSRSCTNAGADAPTIKPGRRSRRPAKPLVGTLLVLVLMLATACNSASFTGLPDAGSAPTPEPVAAATATALPTQMARVGTAEPGGAAALPSSTAVTSQAPSPGAGLPTPTGAIAAANATPASEASPSPTAIASGAGSESPEVSAIKSVIQKANEEEVQAFATNDSSAMSDTATDSYNQQMVQSYNNMVSSGITAVQLLNISWGEITLQDASTAQANTSETWETTFSDGGTLRETDANIYTLVLQNGSWKVQNDQHPDPRALLGQPGTAPTAPTSGPVTATIPSSTAIDQSSNWAGYMVSGSNFTAISGTWTVPSIDVSTSSTINSVASDATWVGIGGADTNDLIQAGTMATVQGTQVMYSAWWETLPDVAQPVPLDVAAGDKVSVFITRQADGTWLITMRNETIGQQFQKSLDYNSSLSSAEWIEEAPATGRMTILPLDNFTPVTFTGAATLQDGQELTVAQAGAQPVAMYGSAQPSAGRFRHRSQTGQAGSLLAQPSGLAADGSSFSVMRSGAATPTVVP